MTTPAWISLGSNLGDRKAILDDAVAALADAPGVRMRSVSSYHETRPVGGPPGQGPFLNAAADLETTLDPHQLLAVLHRVEGQAGRVRTVRWGERTLDLDLLIFGNKFLDTKELRLPHPRLALRRFVLVPLAEIAPTIVDTMTERTIADLLANLDRKPRSIAIDGPPSRRKSLIFRRLVVELPGFGMAEEDQGSPDDLQDEPDAHPIDPFKRKAESLQASSRSLETLREPWVVVDSYVGLPRHTSKLMTREIPRFDQNSRMTAHRSEMERATTLAKTAMLPTLVVILPGDPPTRRGPGLRTAPQLWPDSDEPDAIVAEVVATCRSIDGL